jgi:CRP-like cAMP-binding protein
MDFTPVIRNIEKHVSLTEAERRYFTSLLSARELDRKEVLLYQGQVCSKFNFVVEGILRAYYVDKEGNESIVMFAISDWWITDIYSFTTQQPAIMQIDALEKSLILQLKKEDLERLFVEMPKFERFFRVIMQNSYVREQLRSIQNLSIPAEERYLNFRDKYPDFIRRLPQKQIASYLGVTPEFLSKIRNQLRKK